MFGVNSDATDEAAEDQEPEDIEAAIEKELAAMKSASKPKNSPFDLLKMNVDCVLFMRTRAPVDPLVLVRHICKDAAAAKDKSLWRSRFINKLTPITLTGKATEKGLEDVARKVLSDHFRLAEGEAGEKDDDANNACSVSIHSKGRDATPLPVPTTSLISPVLPSHQRIGPLTCQAGTNRTEQYAIRPTIRAHTTLKRTEVIDRVANMISKRHKVDLENPDKVIIIEIFQVRFCTRCIRLCPATDLFSQTFCGMSVVGKDWETMKRYNIHELYLAALKSAANPEEQKE